MYVLTFLQWGTVDAEIKALLLRNQLYQGFLFKTLSKSEYGFACWNCAFLISAFPVHSDYLFPFLFTHVSTDPSVALPFLI